MRLANESDSKNAGPQLQRNRRGVHLDIALLLFAGLAAECAHSSWRDGRPILNADSAQYVNEAEALLAPERDANFALRKPGYPFLLAGVALLTGEMSWSALTLNHLLLGLVPLAAYGLGVVLLSRWAGWCAAILAIARLQLFVPGDRIMSEAPYMFLMSFGLLAVVTGLTRTFRASRPYLLIGGILFACAWLVRGVALVPIVAALACSVWLYRGEPRRFIRAALCLAVPLIGAVFIECSLNYASQGAFRTSTGSFGLMMMMRTRHMQGLPMSHGDAGTRALALLPERASTDAYRASELDAWVARYRAIHDNGFDEWETDALMKAAAMEIVAAHSTEFLRCSAGIFGRQLLRRDEARHHPLVSPTDRLPCVLHKAGAQDADFEWNWWAYWGLPHRTIEGSQTLALNMRTAAETRSPLAHTEPLPTLRYLSMTPPALAVTKTLASVASIWPVLALVVLVVLRINRPACAIIALAYVLDAALISLCCPSEIAAARYQGIWLVPDTALAATLITALVHPAWQHGLARWTRFAGGGRSENFRKLTAPSL